jgi:hypothetical protein
MRWRVHRSTITMYGCRIRTECPVLHAKQDQLCPTGFSDDGPPHSLIDASMCWGRPSQYLRWLYHWQTAYVWRKEPYDAEDRVYLTRRALGSHVTEAFWAGLDVRERSDLEARELWVEENLVAWRREQARSNKRAAASRPRYVDEYQEEFF